MDDRDELSGHLQGVPSSVLKSDILLLTAFSLGYGLLASIRGVAFSMLNNRLVFQLRSRIFRKLIHQSTSFFDSHEVGSLTSRLTSDAQVISSTISTNLNVALRNALQVSP